MPITPIMGRTMGTIRNFNGNNYHNAPHNSDAFDVKEYQINSGANRLNFDLFKEEDNKPQDVFRVKRTDTPKRGEKWKVFKNEKILFEIEGDNINKGQAAFLRSIDGITWLIGKCKEGLTNLKEMKKALKEMTKKEKQNK
jgi:hypothetical protein